jgi:predicted site-specific integrase-resolvase
MSQSETHLTAQEFASRTGVSPSTVTKRLRDGSLKGKKISGRWMIPESELPGDTAPPKDAQSQTGRFCSVEAFAERTYLTPKGVERYLQNGTLKGQRDAEGQWRVDEKSLELPQIRHLLRE